MDSDKHLEYVGVTNELILSNAKRLVVALGKLVEFRYPLIPGYNDDDENIDHMIDFLKQHDVRQIYILPYQSMYLAKYEQLGMENKMRTTQPPSTTMLEEVVGKFAAAQIEAIVEG